MHSQRRDFDEASAPLDSATGAAGPFETPIKIHLRAPQMPERLSVVLDALNDLERRINDATEELDTLD